MDFTLSESPSHSFYGWLMSQRYRGGAIGDLAHDVAADPDFPTSGGSRSTRRYLHSVGACEGALLAHDTAWTLYREHRRFRRALSQLKRTVGERDDRWLAVEAAMASGEHGFTIELLQRLELEAGLS